MKRRLPFLLVALLGIALWQAGFFLFATERTVVCRLPVSYAQVRKVELQVWQGETLLGRTELSSPDGLTVEPELKVALEPGPHRAVATAWLADGQRSFQRDFDPGQERTVLVEMKKP